MLFFYMIELLWTQEMLESTINAVYTPAQEITKTPAMK